MIQVRRSDERGKELRDWLESRHTFSFGRYYDPAHMGFHTLRVINEDWIAAGGGFPMHDHHDMEILTYVIEGGLEHRDSIGTHSLIRADEVQRMSAGTGVEHSEYNASATEPVHLLQIWILPERPGLQPGYEQRLFPKEEKQGRLRLVASHDGRDGSVSLRQDADLFAAILDAGTQVTHPIRLGRRAWLQLITGSVTLNGERLRVGDGAGIVGEDAIAMTVVEPTHLLLFDLG